MASGFQIHGLFENPVLLLPASTKCSSVESPIYFLIFLSLSFFFFFRVTSVGYGGSQARCQIGAIATGLQHSRSNSGSELCL